MSTSTARFSGRVSRTDVTSVVVASVLGSVAFGILISLTIDEVLLTAIPGMYGFEDASLTTGVFVGWAIHVSHGTALGLVFGIGLTLFPKSGYQLSYGLFAGAVYGVVLWLALASFLMPYWVGLAMPMEPPVPDWELWSLVGHVLYGAFLGTLIPLYRKHE